jgi:hypothetical protein
MGPASIDGVEVGGACTRMTSPIIPLFPNLWPHKIQHPRLIHLLLQQGEEQDVIDARVVAY